MTELLFNLPSQKKKQHLVSSYLIQLKKKPQRGEVVAIPAENKENPITVKVGDQVLYGKYAGTDINIDGNDYLIMSETDILAII